MSVRRHVKVESNNIASMGYDPESGSLEIVFNTDDQVVYRYARVSALAFATLLNAESIGSTFAKSFRNNKDHPFTKVTNDLKKST